MNNAQKKPAKQLRGRSAVARSGPSRSLVKGTRKENRIPTSTASKMNVEDILVEAIQRCPPEMQLQLAKLIDAYSLSTRLTSQKNGGSIDFPLAKAMQDSVKQYVENECLSSIMTSYLHKQNGRIDSAVANAHQNLEAILQERLKKEVELMIESQLVEAMKDKARNIMADAISDALGETVSTFKAQVEESESTIKDVDGRVETIAGRIDASDERFASLTGRIDGLEENITSLIDADVGNKNISEISDEVDKISSALVSSTMPNISIMVACVKAFSRLTLFCCLFSYSHQLVRHS